MNYKPILFLWDVFKVSSKYVKDGKEFLAYQYRDWPNPFSTHIMQYMGTFEGFTASEAISKATVKDL